MARPKKSPDDPFRWFDSSPEVIRLVVMMYVGTVKANTQPADFEVLLGHLPDEEAARRRRFSLSLLGRLLAAAQ